MSEDNKEINGVSSAVTNENKNVENSDAAIVLKTQESFIYNSTGRTNLRNITSAGLSFILENTTGKRGEIFIPAGQSRGVSNEEILIKIEAQNPSICGTDGCGANAALVIEDEAWREHLGFNKGGGQRVLTDEVIAEIFAAKTTEDFKKLVGKYIKTVLEKEKLMGFLREKHKQGKFDSESKIKFIEKYTGLPVEIN